MQEQTGLPEWTLTKQALLDAHLILNSACQSFFKGSCVRLHVFDDWMCVESTENSSVLRIRYERGS